MGTVENHRIAIASFRYPVRGFHQSAIFTPGSNRDGPCPKSSPDQFASDDLPSKARKPKIVRNGPCAIGAGHDAEDVSAERPRLPRCVVQGLLVSRRELGAVGLKPDRRRPPRYRFRGEHQARRHRQPKSANSRHLRAVSLTSALASRGAGPLFPRQHDDHIIGKHHCQMYHIRKKCLTASR